MVRAPDAPRVRARVPPGASGTSFHLDRLLAGADQNGLQGLGRGLMRLQHSLELVAQQPMPVPKSFAVIHQQLGARLQVQQ